MLWWVVAGFAGCFQVFPGLGLVLVVGALVFWASSAVCCLLWIVVLIWFGLFGLWCGVVLGCVLLLGFPGLVCVLCFGFDV